MAASSSEYPVRIAYGDLKKIAERAASNGMGADVLFPTAEQVELHLLDAPPCGRDRMDEVKFFIWCVLQGYGTDDAWHAQNPGRGSGSAEDLLTYVFRPYSGRAIGPHTGVWALGDSAAEQEAKEDGFLLMQGLLSDTDVLQVSPDPAAGRDEACWEIMCRTWHAGNVAGIAAGRGGITARLASARRGGGPAEVRARTFRELCMCLDAKFGRDWPDM